MLIQVIISFGCNSWLCLLKCVDCFLQSYSLDISTNKTMYEISILSLSKKSWNIGNIHQNHKYSLSPKYHILPPNWKLKYLIILQLSFFRMDDMQYLHIVIRRGG
jgi:hypothetical protein